MKTLSLILPTISAYKELDLCLKSIALNSALNNELVIIVDVDKNGYVNQKVLRVLRNNGVRFHLNKKNLGPYGSWNRGAKIAKRNILCFITDDQYFARGWDQGIVKYMRKKFILSGQIVQAGVLLPSFPVVIKDFGEKASNFKEKEFLTFAEKIKEPRLVAGQFFIPLVIYKGDFCSLGDFSTFGEFGVKSVPNDILYIEKAKANGFEFKSSLLSISYHFEASSWEKHKKIRKWKNKLKISIKRKFPALFKKRIGKWEEGLQL